MTSEQDFNLNSLSWETTPSPSPDDAELVDKQLDNYNNANAPLGSVRMLACLAKRRDGGVVGGAIARTWGKCCELQQLWVDERARRNGVGGKLVALVEKEARRRGCSLIYLDTFSFQSPEFYRSLGFETACEMEGFPEGIVKEVMRKKIES